MTEEQWLHSTDPALMVRFLTHQLIQPYDAAGLRLPDLIEQERATPLASARKLRLFACACARLPWERYANATNPAEVAETLSAAEAMAEGREYPVLTRRSCSGLDSLVDPDAARCAEAWAGFGEPPSQADRTLLLRDVVGNPFDPPAGGRPWLGVAALGALDPTVNSLASAAYARRLPDGFLDPARLAVLADALEEAGVPQGVLLAHLRSPGPHPLGAWSLDVVLGKV